ncbi:MAG: XRE family transcriptional regulator [Pseudomonadota bacterium]
MANEGPWSRLRDARKAKRLTAVEAARRAGVPEVTYRSHEASPDKANHRQLSVDHARLYENALDGEVSWAFLLYGDEAAGFGEHPSRSGGPAGVVGVDWLPVWGVAAAGAWSEIDKLSEENPADRPVAPVARIEAFKDLPQYALFVEGDSCNKEIPDGAYAVCAEFHAFLGRRNLETLTGRFVHVERVHSDTFREVTIKQLQRDARGKLELRGCSEDPKWNTPIALEDGENPVTVEIRGVVIGKFQVLT